jgi:hypothetical protein
MNGAFVFDRIFMNIFFQLIALILVVFLSVGCGEDPVEPDTGSVIKEIVPDPIDQSGDSNDSFAKPTLSPIVVENLDQAQEIYEKQENTSFKTGDRGWQRYKASRSGYLTRFSLYGCAHSKGARNKSQIIYGDVIWGEIRLERTNETLGTWSLSRDQVVAQLKSRGLEETDYDWIHVKISDDQRISQVAGETYLIQSVKISDNRPFFGSFRFGVNDPYPDGAWWHCNPKPTAAYDKDLVFMTWVGKTAKQVTEERALRLEEVEQRLQPPKRSVDIEPVPSSVVPVIPEPAPAPVTPPAVVAPIPEPELPDPDSPPDSLPPILQPEEKPAPAIPGTKKPLLPFLRPK